eukprot:COSAG02_NODE_1265_length_13542_cov_5.803615_3_plen_72_part_00
MGSTISHDELSSKLKLAVLGVISTALAEKKRQNTPVPIPVFQNYTQSQYCYPHDEILLNLGTATDIAQVRP